MSREQYVDYAISKGLRLDDTQIRMPVRARTATSLDEYTGMRAGMTPKDVRDNPELTRIDKEFWGFTRDMLAKAGKEIEPGIQVEKDDGQSWVFFKINDGEVPSQGRVDKGYFGFDNPYKSLTPTRMRGFLKALKDAGYKGGVKTVQDLDMATHMSDQIVVHGSSKADVDLAMKIGRKFFESDLTFNETGYDMGRRSYSELLQDKIEGALK